MIHQDLTDALAFFPRRIGSARDISVSDWYGLTDRLADFLSHIRAERRKELFDAANHMASSMHRTNYEKARLWFFLHISFDVFEEFWQNEALRRAYAAYFYQWLRCALRDGGFSRKRYKKIIQEEGHSPHKDFARLYVGILEQSFRFCTLKSGGRIQVVADPFSIAGEAVLSAVLKKTEATILATELGKSDTMNSESRLREYAGIIGYDYDAIAPFVKTGVERLLHFSDDLFLMLAISGMNLVRTGKYGWGPILTAQNHIEGCLRRGRWPVMSEELDISRIPYALTPEHVEYELDEALLRRLCAGSGEVTEALNSIRELRRIKNGRLPIGLKIHYVGGLGPAQTHLNSSTFALEGKRTVILPPVGSVAVAEKVLMRAGELLGIDVFGSKETQIQVCSPGELTQRRAALLGVCAYLGSDQLKYFELGSFRSTHAETGQRIVIYGAGVLESDFEWWSDRSSGVVVKDARFPKALSDGLKRRTDVLGCLSMTDVDNVNLVATLLVHAQYGGRWGELGRQFETDVENVFAQHGLSHVLASAWVQGQGFDAVSKNGDAETWFAAFSELMDYAFADRERVLTAAKWGDHVGARSGILFEMQALLQEYRATVDNFQERVI